MMGFQTVRGMKDFIEDDGVLLQKIFDVCRRNYELFGYIPAFTPAVESFDLLAAKSAAGDAIKNEIYYFKDKSERELGLRFDFTVPLGRIASSNNLAKPFKRFQIGKVWRYDRPGANRYREFYQADGDILGVDSIEAEVELIKIIKKTLDDLGIKGKVRVNNREFMDQLLEGFGFKGKLTDFLRIIDKSDKLGEKAVVEELQQNGFSIELFNFLKTNSLDKAEKILKNFSGFNSLKLFLSRVESLGLKDFVVVDFSLARGLDYYTGMVFEISSDIGLSIGGGGRYDRLVENYGGSPTSAVGISFGVSRLFDILKERNDSKFRNVLFVCSLNQNVESEKLEESLRLNGICVESNFLNKSIKKSIEYCLKRNIRFFCVIGDDEIKQRKFVIRDLANSTEKEFFFKYSDEIQEFLKN